MAANEITLLPQPRQVRLNSEKFGLTNHRFIQIKSENPAQLLFSVRRFQEKLSTSLGLDWEVVANSNLPADLVGLEIKIETGAISQAQGYQLIISNKGIQVIAEDLPGAFYGICTLNQVVEMSGGELPGMQVLDWPDFTARGVMLDISRDKVPSMATLYQLVDRLASWKINQLQLYTEHTFAYHNHPEVWSKASPVTGEEILELDTYCRERYIELVPNQNSFGHMHRWLEHPRYAPLAEVHGQFEVPWGIMQGPFSLCPTDPDSLDLLRSMYDELLPHFSSRMFNVGCDETWDLGYGRSRQACAEKGIGQVYLDFLLQIYQEVRGRGFKMQFWGDILLNHPELIPQLPKDIIALEWGYEANHPFAERTAQFAAAGVPFYVCPGTSAWNSLAGRTTNAIGNLLSAAENGLKHGAIGYLNTDWGDSGHWQPLPVSYLGFAVGAAYSWALQSNRHLDIRKALSIHAFEDASGRTGQAVYALGDVYKAVGIEPGNASALFGALTSTLEKIRAYPGISAQVFYRSLQAIDWALQPLDGASMSCPDAVLVRREIELSAWMMRHACRRGLLALEENPARCAEWRQALDEDLLALMGEYQQVWLARNRVGGLTDSLARFEKARQDYRG